jgi:hypothetical protein
MRRLLSIAPSRALCRLAILMAAASVLLGAWNVFVLDRQRPGMFWQLVFPLIMLRLSVTLYRRSRHA